MTDCQYCAVKHGRGRPPTHALWYDSQAKACRSLRQHPGYETCRKFQSKAINPPDPEHPYANKHGDAEHFALDARWKADIAAFTYEMTLDAGFPPEPVKQFIIWPTDPRKPVGPGNVSWIRRPRDIRAERRRQIRSLEAQDAIRSLLSEADIRPQPDGSHLLGAVADRIRHVPSCETSWIDPIECPCTEFIRDHFASF